LSYNRKDFFYKKAKKENYAARSVFKLEEIGKRFQLFKKGQKVLDLGAAPGSWSQYVSEKIGQSGRVLAVDLQEIGLTLPNVFFVKSDIRELDWENIFLESEIKPPFDLVISDMAPKTTGIQITDQTRSMDLCEFALSIALTHLKPSGHFICKLFHGGEFEIFRNKIKKEFGKAEVLRPQSTRTHSKEIFLIGIKKNA
jgi:23S rRNA (uridine2552-2'-O)-methyltransferase